MTKPLTTEQKLKYKLHRQEKDQAIKRRREEERKVSKADEKRPEFDYSPFEHGNLEIRYIGCHEFEGVLFTIQNKANEDESIAELIPPSRIFDLYNWLSDMIKVIVELRQMQINQYKKGETK